MQTNTNQAVIPAIVIGVSLIVSSYILSSGIREYGRSLERAAQHQPPATVIPSELTLSVEGGNSPVRLQSN